MEALSELRTSKPELLFLDVEMPEYDGFDVLEMLGAISPRSNLRHGFRQMRAAGLRGRCPRLSLETFRQWTIRASALTRQGKSRAR